MADGLLDRIGRTLRTAGSGIGDILAAGGQAYAPPDMNLTRNQQMGLLGSRLGDMMVGPRGEMTNNTPAYLDNIRRENELARRNQSRDQIVQDVRALIADQTITPTVGAAIIEQAQVDPLAARGSLDQQTRRSGLLNALPGLTEEGLSPGLLDVMSNLPTESISNITEGLLDARFGGTTAGLTAPVFRDTTTQKLVPSQLLDTGGFLIGGQQYGGVGQPPIPENLEYIGPTMAYDVPTAADLAYVRAEQDVLGEAAGNYAVFTNEEYMTAQADFQGFIEGNLARQRREAENNADLQGAAREAELKRIDALLDNLDNAFARTASKETQFNLLTGLFEQAREQASKLSTGLSGQALMGIGGTEALELQKTIDAIAANVGFDKLQAMRDLSKTGGALGNVSNVELNLLTSSLGSLSTEVGYDTFLRNLERVQNTTTALWEQAQENFRREFGVDYFDPNAEGAANDLITQRRRTLLGIEDLSLTPTPVDQVDTPIIPLTGDDLLINTPTTAEDLFN